MKVAKYGSHLLKNHIETNFKLTFKALNWDFISFIKRAPIST